MVFKTEREELLDITREVADAVKKSGIENGTCFLWVPHTTCGLTINENADPSVKSDILMALRKAVPENLPYRHMEGNSTAHVKSSLLGCQLSLFVESGNLVLGTWQAIFLAEFDGPRTRKVFVKAAALKEK